MADPRAFISFDFDHNETEKVLFIGQAKNSKTPFSIQDWSAKSSMAQSEWEKIVKDKINRSIARHSETTYASRSHITSLSHVCLSL